MFEQNNPMGDGIYSNNPLMKLRNLEEKQRMLKERLLLIGENLIDMREKNREEILEMKKNFEIIRNYYLLLNYWKRSKLNIKIFHWKNYPTILSISLIYGFLSAILNLLSIL